jgi:hypothetical protein
LTLIPTTSQTGDAAGVFIEPAKDDPAKMADVEGLHAKIGELPLEGR